MHQVEYTKMINVPAPSDLATFGYSRAVSRAQGQRRFLWDVIMTPENIVRAIHAAQIGRPGIEGVAQIISDALKQAGLPLDAPTKQLAGVFVSTALQANGMRKSGRTSVSHPDFSQATLFA